uniref:G domain-containing protein n=1 Tax=Globodera rostochiensis TaxID=31243 RepID=A0A914I7P7_GLORO
MLAPRNFIVRGKSNGTIRRAYPNKALTNSVPESAAAIERNKSEKIASFSQNNNSTCNVKQSKDDEIEREEREFTELKIAFGLNNISASLREQRLLLVHPRVRGMTPKNTTVQQQIDEAQTLCETIPGFKVVSAIVLATDAQSLRKKLVWGWGRLERIREWMHKHPVNALCVNIDILTPDQQIALAEIPYIRERLCYIDSNKNDVSSVEGLAESLQVANMVPTFGKATEGTRRVELLRLREHSLRKQIRNAIETNACEVRQRLDAFASTNASKMAVIGVIGYTNAGKTSLIKAHNTAPGRPPIPSQNFVGRHNWIYFEFAPQTVRLVHRHPSTRRKSCKGHLKFDEHFILLKDLLVHVMDLSHPDILAQRDQVMGTLKGLNIRRELMDGIITVGNKLDKCGPERVKWLKRRALLPPDEDDVDSAEPTTLSSYPSPPSVFPLPISCRTLDGLSSLIWKMDFSIRSIIGSRVRRFRLAPESSAIPYLYSSGLVPVEGPKTSECGQFLIFDIAMTDAQFARFKTVLGAKIKF